jgi:hypothetical protein
VAVVAITLELAKMVAQVVARHNQERLVQELAVKGLMVLVVKMQVSSQVAVAVVLVLRVRLVLQTLVVQVAQGGLLI